MATVSATRESHRYTQPSAPDLSTAISAAFSAVHALLISSFEQKRAEIENLFQLTGCPIDISSPRAKLQACLAITTTCVAIAKIVAAEILGTGEYSWVACSSLKTEASKAYHVALQAFNEAKTTQSQLLGTIYEHEALEVVKTISTATQIVKTMALEEQRLQKLTPPTTIISVKKQNPRPYMSLHLFNMLTEWLHPFPFRIIGNPKISMFEEAEIWKDTAITACTSAIILEKAQTIGPQCPLSPAFRMALRGLVVAATAAVIQQHTRKIPPSSQITEAIRAAALSSNIARTTFDVRPLPFNKQELYETKAIDILVGLKHVR